MQQFLAGPRANAPTTERVNQDRPVKLPEFTRLVKGYTRDRTDPTAVEHLIEELEKAFKACQVPEDRKLSLVAFLLKKDANNW